MLKQDFLAHFEPLVRRFGTRKPPKCPEKECLEKGRFGTKAESKMGQKRVVAKVILDHSRCTNK